MSKKPWMKFSPADWRSDRALRLCSRGAQALWIDLIGLMHEAEPYGHLLTNGRAMTIDQMGKLLGDPLGDLEAWLSELEENGVFSRTDEGVIFSRRMVRDFEKASLGKEFAEKRWVKPKGIPNGSPNGTPNAKNIEARDIDICPLQDSADAKSEAPKPEVRSKRAKARTSLSEDWKLGDREREYAVSEGMPAAAVDLQAKKFRDHHIAKGSLMADWAAAWRTWVSNYKGFNPSLPLAAPPRSDDATRWDVLYTRWRETGRWREERDGPPPYEPGHRGPMKVKPTEGVAA